MLRPIIAPQVGACRLFKSTSEEMPPRPEKRRILIPSPAPAAVTSSFRSPPTATFALMNHRGSIVPADRAHLPHRELILSLPEIELARERPAHDLRIATGHDRFVGGQAVTNGSLAGQVRDRCHLKEQSFLKDRMLKPAAGTSRSSEAGAPKQVLVTA
jgi:hypothetical protein